MFVSYEGGEMLNVMVCEIEIEVVDESCIVDWFN